MRRTARVLAAFSAAALAAGLARGLTTTYLPVLLDRIRDAPGWIGTVMLVNSVAGLVVPLVVGVWSDRLRARGHTRTLPFILGGSLVTAGGLAAIALGSATSYLALALFAAVAYAGLNAVTTAHRALIPETFAPPSQAAATAWEEGALLLGGAAGVVVGGALLELAPWAPFALGAVAVPLLAAPTVLRRRDAEPGARVAQPARRAMAYYARAAVRPGARVVLLAQALWVLGYVGLTPFFVLFADKELGLRPSAAALVLASFGGATALTMLAAGRIRVERRPLALAAGAALMAGGLAAVAAATTLWQLAAPLAAAAVGFGLLTTLGFPVFGAWIPEGEEGGYSALYFAARAAAALVALPACGWTIAVTGSYRGAFAFGAAAAAASLLPLLTLVLSADRRRRLFRLLVLAGSLAAGTAAVLAFGLAAAATAIDKRVFQALNGLGGTPLLLDAAIVDPHISNYVALTLLAAVIGRLRGVPLRATLPFVAAAGLLSFAVVRVIWAVWERPRPQELLGDVAANSHDWAPYPSFPSGHVAVTVAIAVAASRATPILCVPLGIYAALVAVTRITYGAHFPSDVLGGAVLGGLAALAAAALLRELGVAADWFGAADLARLRRRLGPLLRRRTARRAAGVSSVAAALLFFVLLETVGPPHGPEGGVLPASTEYVVNRLLYDAVVLTALAAWWRHGAGGAAMLLVSVAIGVFARLEYSPEAALLACLAFFVPALLWLVASDALRTNGKRLSAAAAAVALLALGGFAGERVHAMAFGPSHPESPTRALPPSALEWVWAGAVTENGVTVNAKLAADGRARLLVSMRRSLADAVASTSGRANEDVNDRVVSLSVDGLQADRRHYYAVEVDGRIDRTRQGSFRTLPRGPASFTVAFGSCSRTGSNGAVFDAIRVQRPLLYLISGDFFYANIDEADADRFRSAYGATLSAPAQAALYRSVPVAYVWDDHDYGPDDGDRTSPSRETAQRVYRELVPHYPLPAGSAGPIYQSFTIGRVRFLLTDLRSERTPDSTPDGPRKTMLGAAQKRWLERELAQARRAGQLAVWASSVPWIAGPSAGSDSWAGFASERRALADAIATAGGPLLMLGGDAHMLAIDDGSHSAYGGRGFPVMHAAALDRPGGTKGGPYSEGAVGGSGQFGTMRVEDDGRGPIRVTLTGRRYDGKAILRYSYSADVGGVS